jgi:hypothetical protein
MNKRTSLTKGLKKLPSKHAGKKLFVTRLYFSRKSIKIVSKLVTYKIDCASKQLVEWAPAESILGKLLSLADHFSLRSAQEINYP